MLPFKITSRIIDQRGGVIVTATINGEPVALEKHSLGDGRNRKLIAEKWAAHPRIVGSMSKLKGAQRGSTGTELVELIVVDIERVEIEALPELEKFKNRDDDTAAVIEAPNYLDDDFMAELAWNSSTSAPDFITYNWNQKSVERGEIVTIEKGRSLIMPSSASGIVTPGGRIRGTIFLPTEYDPLGENEAKLRQDVQQFVDRYVELPGDTASIAVEYILLTWVHDRFDELPYLAFRTSDAGRGKSRALET